VITKMAFVERKTNHTDCSYDW